MTPRLGRPRNGLLSQNEMTADGQSWGTQYRVVAAATKPTRIPYRADTASTSDVFTVPSARRAEAVLGFGYPIAGWALLVGAVARG